MLLKVDSRSGVHNKDITFNNCDLIEAQTWLKKLDGQKHTLLAIEKPNGHQLMVGGGPLWYIVTLFDGRENFTLPNLDSKDVEFIEICAGGQFGEFSKNYCVLWSRASEVISSFFNNSEKKEIWM